MIFKVKGKIGKVSLQEVRAILFATDTVLSFHKRTPLKTEIIILFRILKRSNI